MSGIMISKEEFKLLSKVVHNLINYGEFLPGEEIFIDFGGNWEPEECFNEQEYLNLKVLSHRFKYNLHDSFEDAKELRNFDPKILDLLSTVDALFDSTVEYIESHLGDRLDEPFIIPKGSKRGWTGREVIEVVKERNEDGIEFLKGFLLLTMDLLSSREIDYNRDRED